MPNLAEILQVALPSTITVIVLILTFNRENRISKKDTLRSRLDDFYVPFYIMCSKKSLYEMPISNIDVESILEIHEFLLNNIHFLDTISQHHVLQLHQTLLTSRIETDDDSIESYSSCYFTPGYYDLDEARISQDGSHTKLDIKFQELMDYIFDSHFRICRKLKLPQPASNRFQIEEKIIQAGNKLEQLYKKLSKEP